MADNKIINSDLKFIKKHYGEKFAHLCRELFPTILEHEGLLAKTISDKFAPTRTLYDVVFDQKELFRSYIFNLAGIKKPRVNVPEENKNLSPKELLDKAGYILYDECKTEEDINKFKKYFAKDELLCTFNGKRLNSCRVWFAVKKDVDEIKREDFKNPMRQDRYGTSVISIQFTKDEKSEISIKNRYNHAVDNCDATFSNNLDNIIPGLTNAFEQSYGIHIFDGEETELYLDDYVYDNNVKCYRKNISLNNVSFCENNVVVDNGEAVKLDKGRYILIDQYLVDLKENTIKTYNEWKHAFKNDEKDSFLKSIGDIKKINLSKDENGNKVLVITPELGDNIEITIGSRNEIIGYKNHNVTEISDCFLNLNKDVQFLDLPNVREVEYNFLTENSELESLIMPSLEVINNNFLTNNQKLKSLDLPNVKKIGNRFLYYNSSILSINLPNVEEIGNSFMESNNEIESIIFPNLIKLGGGFMNNNSKISKVEMPKVKSIGDYVLMNNDRLKRIYLPEVEKVGSNFLMYNSSIREIILPKVKNVGNFFLKSNKFAKEISLPSLERIGQNFMSDNNSILSVYLPEVTEIYSRFLRSNEVLENLELPKVEYIGEMFLECNNSLSELYLNKLLELGALALNKNNSIKSVELPEVRIVKIGFLEMNEVVEEVEMPKITAESCQALPELLRNLIKNGSYMARKEGES